MATGAEAAQLAARPLRRTQRSDHRDWLAVWAAITAAPDHARASRLIESAATRVAARAAHAEHPVYGWSGGKDSLALALVAEQAGVSASLLVISGLEWPEYLSWATANMPWGLTVELRGELDLAWLAAHPRMIFPRDSDTAARWFALVQHAGQRAYAARTHTDLMLLGRRHADGNYCGAPSPYGGHAYRDRAGFERYSPISDWTHEDVLHVLASRRVDLPPCYRWPRGFRVGTGPWPARQWTDSPSHGWRECLAIDASVVVAAANARVPGAREALNSSRPRPS